MIETNSFLGLKYSLFNLQELKTEIILTIINNRKKVFYGYSLTLLPKFKHYPEIYSYSNQFDYFLADGKGYFFFLRLFGVKLKSDISLPDLANIILDMANKDKFSVLLIGADKKTNSIATKNIKNNYPKAEVFEGIDGYFSKQEEVTIIEKINIMNPDIILIGISSPKKERIAYEWKEILNCKIIVPCGGVIDVLAGKTKREPFIVKKLGLTWLYRVVQEPIRLFKPLLIGGISVVFFLIPKILFEVVIKKNKEFSIPNFYGID